jgi:Trk K+ transport system NAD-binding subunit
VNIVMHKRDGSVSINPRHDLTLKTNDRMLVIAPIEKIATLEKGN